jgi:hypothetical protein
MSSTGFLAKFPGKCLQCGLAIHPGHDRIVGIPGTKFCYHHVDCTTAHVTAEVRRFMDAGRDVAAICDLMYGEIAAGRMDYDTANIGMNYAAEYAA